MWIELSTEEFVARVEQFFMDWLPHSPALFEK